jgi:hypothetical protein
MYKLREASPINAQFYLKEKKIGFVQLQKNGNQKLKRTELTLAADQEVKIYF